MHGAVAGRQGLWRDQRQGRQQQAARRRTQQLGARDQRGHPLGPRHQPHQAHGEYGADQAKAGEQAIVHRRQGDRGLGVDHHGIDTHQLGHQGAGQGGGGHRGDVGHGVGADHHLEGVEGAGQRRAERRGDGRPGPGPDEGAKVAAAQVQRPAGERGQGAADLGVGRLQAHRGAEAVGDDGLADDEQAVAQGHAAAVQGVGLHRVDGGTGPPARPQPGDDAQHQAAQGQHRRPRRRNGGHGAQAGVKVDAVEQLLDAVRHGGDGQGRDPRCGPHAGGDQHKPQLAGPDLAAQEGQGGEYGPPVMTAPVRERPVRVLRGRLGVGVRRGGHRSTLDGEWAIALKRLEIATPRAVPDPSGRLV